ncbi:unnamed protein product [Paramecium sonneborni]|uniref:Uncharacterized protein n=1 Tax=Paramecium sonneborni TaxID=65129 RepID=A0A8S1R280_9CILI|nr:unnamed protein product [Paramecium sonneborni]
MNEICLTQNYQLFQMLYLYLQKHGQNISNLSMTKLLELFISNWENTYSKKEIKIAQFKRTIFQKSQEIAAYQNNIDTQQQIISNIKNIREKFHIDLDFKDVQLQQIEKSINSINKNPSINQKMQDLKEGINICTERFLLIKEENEEFNKTLISQGQLNLQLKNRYQFVQNQIKNNHMLLDELKENHANLNNRLIKQLQIVIDLDQFNKRKPLNKKRNQYVMKLKELINEQSELELSSKYNILEILENILEIKDQLSQINFKDNQQTQHKDKQKDNQISILQKFRSKTHHNLFEKGQRKLSQYRETQVQDQIGLQQREQDEIEENDSQYHQRCISPKQPWHFKSVIVDSNKNSEKIMEYQSEQQIKSQNQKSLASISSDDSFHRIGVITLKEELQTVYSYDQTQEDNKEYTIYCDDNDERNEIVMKMQQILHESQQEKNESVTKNRRNIEIISLVLMTIGVTGWLYMKKK